MPKVEEIIEVKGKRFKVVERPVDPPNTVRRYLVPADTEENDIPIGSTMLDERESDGLISRGSKPDPIIIGVRVRSNEDSKRTGTVEAQHKSGKFKVRWEDGSVDRVEAKELRRIW